MLKVLQADFHVCAVRRFHGCGTFMHKAQRKTDKPAALFVGGGKIDGRVCGATEQPWNFVFSIKSLFCVSVRDTLGGNNKTQHQRRNHNSSNGSVNIFRGLSAADGSQFTSGSVHLLIFKPKIP